MSIEAIQPGNILKNASPTTVRGVNLHHFKHISDPRGDLCVGEFIKEIPFIPKRYFLVFNVPEKAVRGEHAHYECHQFLLCVKGSCTVLVDDGKNKEEIVLNSAGKGIYLPPLTWASQYAYSQDAVQLVFTSDYYDADDYIRDYEQFRQITEDCPV